jgi:hypothetical protein
MAVGVEAEMSVWDGLDIQITRRQLPDGRWKRMAVLMHATPAQTMAAIQMAHLTGIGLWFDGDTAGAREGMRQLGITIHGDGQPVEMRP